MLTLKIILFLHFKPHIYKNTFKKNQMEINPHTDCWQRYQGNSVGKMIVFLTNDATWKIELQHEKK